MRFGQEKSQIRAAVGLPHWQAKAANRGLGRGCLPYRIALGRFLTADYKGMQREKLRPNWRHPPGRPAIGTGVAAG